MKEKILNILNDMDISLDSIAKSWQEIVEIESYTHDPKSVAKLSEHLKQEFETLGLKTKEYTFENSGPLLVAEMGTGPVEEGIILTGHMDTVFKTGTLQNRPFTIEDDKVFGPGVLDMKGGLNLIPYIIKILKHTGYEKPIKVIIAGDEEHGHAHSNCAELMRTEAAGYKCAFNLETGLINNGITIARKGRIACKIKTYGKSAHAGANFADGINAIYEITRILQGINQLNQKYSNASFSAGTIQGGKIPNAIPDYAEAELDIRYYDAEDYDRIQSDIHTLCTRDCIAGARSEAHYGGSFPSFTDNLNQRFYTIVNTESINLGFGETSPEVLGGSSDASFLTLSGVPVLCSMGVKGEWNHTDREYALLSSAWERLILITASILRLEDKPL